MEDTATKSLAIEFVCNCVRDKRTRASYAKRPSKDGTPEVFKCLASHILEENACPGHHKDIELIDATGSSGVVKAQFSPGKPALRVGPATFRAHIEMPSGSGRQHHLQHVGQRHPMGPRTSLMIDEWRTMPGQAPIAGATARPQVRYLHAAFVVQTSLQPSIPSRRA